MSQIVQPAWEDPLYCYGLCAIIAVPGLEQAPCRRVGNVEKAACSESSAEHSLEHIRCRGFREIY
jgi:hypothetical protein